MIKLGIIVIASSTMALSTAIVQDDHDQQIPPQKQVVVDNSPKPASGALADPLKRNKSLSTKAITSEIIDDCLEVAREIDPKLAMWLEKLQTNSSRGEFEHAIQRNARYLLGLVELREDNPVLYDLKMRELKTGAEINEVTQLLQEAIDTQSIDQAEMLKVRLRELVSIRATYSIETDGKYLLRIREYATSLEKRLGEQGASFNETVQQQLDEILEKINANSSAQTPSTTSG